MAAAGVSSSPRSVWLHNGPVDLMLGAGLGYVVSVPLLLVFAAASDVGQWPLEVVLVLGIAFSTPHYGATLLRVYEQREDRNKYAFFTVYVSLLIALLLALALASPLLGSLLITLYFSWSPWHFAGQNYGLSLMFLRRRGTAVPPQAKRALYAAFAFSFLLALLVFHTHDSSATFAPDFSSSDRHYEVLRAGIPSATTSWLAPLLIVAFLAALAVGATQLRRAGATYAGLVPVALLVLSQALWFMVPAYGATAGWSIEGLAFSAVWASTAHSLQYLWVTSYYARGTKGERRLLPFYAKALLAGCIIGVVPGLLAAGLAPGSLSWTSGLGILVFASVNLHHFVLDGAIWKLRDSRVGGVLLRSEAPGSQTGSGPRRPAARLVIWGTGFACLAMLVIEVGATHAVRSNDVERLRSAAQQLAWIHRERVSVLRTLGDLLTARGERDPAVRAYRRALGLRRDETVLNNLAWLLAVDPRSTPQQTAEAVELATEAMQHSGEHDYGIMDTLAAAYAAAGRYEDAARTATRALKLARPGDAEFAARLEPRLALYRAGQPYREGAGAPPR